MIFKGNCINTLKEIDGNSIHCCVTSPPYWGLRDYGHDDQIGLEGTPEQYVEKIVDVFREVKRVLRPDGTLWLNLGDSYYGGGWKGSATDLSGTKHATNKGTLDGKTMAKDPPHPIIKTKDLVGIPWLVAFALRADGWYLRQDVIWHKPNPMPESVTDRCTKSHEYIFLLSRSNKYYYDAEAVMEKSVSSGPRGGNLLRDTRKGPNGGKERWKGERALNWSEKGRNKRSVWTIATKPYAEAHFATFPEELITPCILAGCPEGGIVLDPFLGSGTTAVVAIKNNRNWVGCELNPDYIEIAEKRISIAQHNQNYKNAQITIGEAMTDHTTISKMETTTQKGTAHG